MRFQYNHGSARRSTMYMLQREMVLEHNDSSGPGDAAKQRFAVTALTADRQLRGRKGQQPIVIHQHG